MFSFNMLYTGEKAAQWLDRSKSREYQGAYNNMATIVRKQIADGEVAFEAGCGIGEMLKRLCAMNRFRLVVGTDISLEMLRIAQANLAQEGIEAPIRDPATINCIDAGVILVQDDIVNSRLPDECADIALFTFPELGVDYGPDPIDGVLTQKYEQLHGGPFGSQYPEMIATARSFFHITRALKHRANYVMANYEISHGTNSDYDLAQKRNRKDQFLVHGCRIEWSRFFESPGVWKDTEASKVVRIQGATILNKTGYHVTISRKEQQFE